jgi:Homeodomain-like domain
MRTGRPIPPLTLTRAEHEVLDQWGAAPEDGASRGAARAADSRMRRRQDQHRGRARVAADQAAVGKWRARFLKRRLDGLLDEPRPGAPRTISDAQVEAVLTRTLETRTGPQDPNLSDLPLSWSISPSACHAGTFLSSATI